MNSIPCDIVILPSEDLKFKTIDLSKSLQSENTLYTLDGVKFHPHSSIYMAQLKIDDLDQIKSLLFEIASRHKPLHLKATNYTQLMGFVDIEYQRNNMIDELASIVVNAINPLRDGMREKDRQRMASATGLALHNFQTYGYKYVGELFRPHISITRYKDESVIDTSLLPSPDTFSSSFLKLGLFEMGDNGTCVREIASFDLR